MTDVLTLRADAQRNRERILSAAEEVFLEKGASASLDDVAKRAGVGIGTLYRRFPSREDLLAAAYSARFSSLAIASECRSATYGPLAALCIYLEELVQYTTVYRGLAFSLGAVLQVGSPGCIATSREGERLLTHAINEEAIRSDVSFDDLVCIAVAISLSVEKYDERQARIRHLVSLFLNGISKG